MKRKNAKINVAAVVPAAGRGTRFKFKEKKPFANLNKRPVLLYALKTLQLSPLVSDIVLVMSRPLIGPAKRLVKRHRITKVRHIVVGGKRRCDSVREGLRWIGKDASFVLIHDGVRPFLNKGIIKRAVAAAARFGACVSAVPVKSTIKISGKGNLVRYTPDRKDLWEVQTPQVFRRGLIEGAYKRLRSGRLFTDDASLLEATGAKVKIIKGDYSNIKITTAEDIKIAEALLRKA
jgi:2-C-methyl-D-erythritol 4-phosphate cytidylyltransferase